MCSFFGAIKSTNFGSDLGKPVGQAFELATGLLVAELTTIHIEQMPGDKERLDDRREAGLVYAGALSGKRAHASQGPMNRYKYLAFSC